MQNPTPSSAKHNSVEFDGRLKNMATCRVDWANEDTVLQAMKTKLRNHNVPNSYKEAIHESEVWLKPMQEEFVRVEERGVWEKVPQPTDRNKVPLDMHNKI